MSLLSCYSLVVTAAAPAPAAAAAAAAAAAPAAPAAAARAAPAAAHAAANPAAALSLLLLRKLDSCQCAKFSNGQRPRDNLLKRKLN